MKKIYFGIISLICIISLIVNAFWFHSWLSHKQHMKYVESDTMVSVSNKINQASKWMPKHKTSAIGRLTEVSGNLSTLSSMLSLSQEQTTRTQMNNVAYYLHFQDTATSHNGLSQFMNNANELLQSHITKGRYNVNYLSSDIANLENMLPKSFRWRVNQSY